MNEIEQKRNCKIYMCCKGIIALKISPYFSMGYSYKYHKSTFYSLNIQPHVRISKNISGHMVLNPPPWHVFLINFPQNRRRNVNNCVMRVVTLSVVDLNDYCNTLFHRLHNRQKKNYSFRLMQLDSCLSSQLKRSRNIYFYQYI